MASEYDVAGSGHQRTPLSAEERASAEANFTPLVAQHLITKGRFPVSAVGAEEVELFQRVARRVSDALRRPVVSYANGREIVIAFGDEPEGLANQGARPVQG